MEENTPPQRPAFSVCEEHRARWNVLDMITVVAKGSVPTYMFMDIDMTWAENLRSQFKLFGRKVTVTAILLKAIGVAQRGHPDSRTAALPFGKRAILHDIVAGFTVERFVGSQPAVFFGAIDAPDTKPLEVISDELKSYSEQEMPDVQHLAKQHWFNYMPWLFRQIIIWFGQRFPAFRLRHMGATFGLSSLGKFGVKAIIPPCASTSTFGVGEVEYRPVVRDGMIEIRPMMTITLNFDHRIIDGAPAARFLSDVRNLMEGGLEAHITDSLTTLAESLKKKEVKQSQSQLTAPVS